MPRETFASELHDLEMQLAGMADAVDQAIGSALRALVDRDRALAEQVIAGDLEINQREREIVERCLVLIATQQPMAGDLRVILSVYSIASELERMGDHAEGVANISLRLMEEPLLKPLIDIPRMAETAREMLKEQMQAFLQRDVERARRASSLDDLVDNLYDQVYRELLVYMMQDPSTIRRATLLLWVAHNLERIADRTTNIGERVLFLVTGRVEELNPTPKKHER
jgi:phosphate transport system protein